MSESPRDDDRDPRPGLLGLLLARPGELADARPGRGATAVLFAVAAACFAGYGAVAGFFTGGPQIAIAALKAPLILVLALALCLPSFAVFHLLAGGRLDAGGLVRATAGFAATLGLLLAALAPLAWLFSISSRWLTTAVLCHLAIFGVALCFALRFLCAAVGGGAACRAAAAAWTVIFWLAAVQLSTYLGPVLVPEPAAEVFPLERGSFLGRFGEVLERDDSRAPGE